MKKLSILFGLLLACAASGINVTNYPMRTTVHSNDWFWLSSVPDKTNYNVSYTDLLNQLKSDITNAPPVVTNPPVATALRYFGSSTNTILSNPQLLALSSESASSLAKTWTATPNLEYIYYGYPASWGASAFIVNTFVSTSWTLMTNTFGSTNYNVYRSNNILLGSYDIQAH